MLNLGFYLTSGSRTHVGFQFSTHALAGGNVAPNSAFEAADIRIYRAADGAAFSATQRSSANGITMTSPFDSLAGLHDVDIDLTDNSDAGFYASGYRYTVVLAPDETVDGQTITGVVLAYFEIGVRTANVTQVAGTVQTAGDLAAILQTLDDYVDDLETRVPAAFSELTGVPGATPTLAQLLMWLYMQARNELTATATEQKVRKDDGTVIGTANLSDDGTTFTRGEFA